MSAREYAVIRILDKEGRPCDDCAAGAADGTKVNIVSAENPEVQSTIDLSEALNARKLFLKNAWRKSNYVRHTPKTLDCDKSISWAEPEYIDEDRFDPEWNYTTALDVWSQYWNLSRPVLLEKTPSQWKRIKTMADGIMKAPLPKRMHEAGIKSLEIRGILMWRPWCIYSVSQHARESIETMGMAAYLRKEHRTNRKLAAKHRYLTEKLGLKVLVISFGDLMWRREETVLRLQEFLPQLGKLDTDFEARLGIDVFEGNLWKSSGPLSAFAAARTPERNHFDVTNGWCDKAQLEHYHMTSAWHDLGSVWTDEEAQSSLAAADYLNAVSRAPPGWTPSS